MNHVIRNRSLKAGALGMSLLGALALGASAWAGDAGSKFKAMDADGDGAISATEHAAGASKMFGELDANRDGNVTAAELDARHGMKSASASSGMTSNDASAMTSNDAAMDDRRGKSAEKISALDTNGDGMLSASEHEAGARSKFSEMDTDGNGSLSQQELNAGHDAMKSDRKP